MNKKEEAYVLIIVLIIAAVVSILSLYFTYYIQREYEIIRTQQDKIREKFKIIGIESIIKNQVEKKATEKLKKDSLTKGDLIEFKKIINNYDNEINLSQEQYVYQIKEVFDLNARVNLNQANKKDLKLLPGIGETLSKRIVDNRSYNQLNELKRLKGVGEATVNDIKSLVTLSGTEKININTANDLAWEIINQSLDFKLNDYISSNKVYSDLEELLTAIDEKEEEKINKLKTKGQQLIKFNSDLIGIKYEIINLKNEDKFSGEKIIEF